MNSQPNSSFGNANRRSLLIPRSRRREFVIRFTILTVLGFAMGGAFGQLIDQLVRQVLVNRSVKEFLVNNFTLKLLFQLPLEALYGNRYEGSVLWLGEILKSSTFGALLGTAQWLTLRRYLSFSKLWIISTSIGYAISSLFLLLALITTFSPQFLKQLVAFVFSFLPASLNYTPGGLIPLFLLAFLSSSFVTNISLGLAQWLILRRSLHSIWWWISVPIAAGLISTILSLPIFLGMRLFFFNVRSNMVYTITLPVIGGISYGIVQGVSLCACRRRTNPPTVQP